jgi:hypothetical protein
MKAKNWCKKDIGWMEHHSAMV